jgi:4'-phosphopantetheinyl transferase
MTLELTNSSITVDIWMWDIAEFMAQSERLTATLSTTELARRDRQFSREKGQLWAVSRGKVREQLAKLVGTTARSLVFEENEFGKLRIASPLAQGLDFSISHDGSSTVLAVCRGAEIGVDIEAVKTLSRAEMDWPLSPRERDHLSKVAETEVPRAFFRYWALKEAFIKALGLGVSFPLEDFDMTPYGEEPALLRVEGDPDAARNWAFEAFEIRPGLWFALAVKSAGKRPEFAFHTKTE